MRERAMREGVEERESGRRESERDVYREIEGGRRERVTRQICLSRYALVGLTSYRQIWPTCPDILPTSA